MKKTLFLLMSALILLLSSCTKTAKLPTCAPGSPFAPELGMPANNTLASLTPLLGWTFPDTTCSPEQYKVHLATGPYFRDELGGSASPVGTGGFWSPTKSLAPATFYEWWVTPLNGGKEGVRSWRGVFFTGPVCKAEDLIAPTLLEPGNGDSFYTATRYFHWRYDGGCVPDRYEFQFMSRSGTAYGAQKTDYAEGRGIFNPYLEPCDKGYWTVAAIVGTTVGPFADAFQFTQYSGTDPGKTCPGAPPAPTGYAPSLTPIAATLISAGPLPIFVEVIDNAICRSGPGTMYDLLVYLSAGDSLSATGRNQDSSWLVVERPDGHGECWASSSLLHVPEDISTLPVIVPPPVPTLTVPAPTSVSACYVMDPITQAVSCVSPCPGNAQPGGACTP